MNRPSMAAGLVAVAFLLATSTSLAKKPNGNPGNSGGHGKPTNTAADDGDVSGPGTNGGHGNAPGAEVSTCTRKCSADFKNCGSAVRTTRKDCRRKCQDAVREACSPGDGVSDPSSGDGVSDPNSGDGDDTPECQGAHEAFPDCVHDCIAESQGNKWRCGNEMRGCKAGCTKPTTP